MATQTERTVVYGAGIAVAMGLWSLVVVGRRPKPTTLRPRAEVVMFSPSGEQFEIAFADQRVDRGRGRRRAFAPSPSELAS